jgi:hypothetical protein
MGHIKRGHMWKQAYYFKCDYVKCDRRHSWFSCLNFRSKCWNKRLGEGYSKIQFCIRFPLWSVFIFISIDYFISPEISSHLALLFIKTIRNLGQLCQINMNAFTCISDTVSQQPFCQSIFWTKNNHCNFEIWPRIKFN